MPVSEPTKVVAIIAANTALSSLLAMVVAGDSHLKVRQFESDIDLVAYMRIAPIDFLQRCERNFQGMSPGVGLFALVLDPAIDKRGPLFLDGDLGSHLRFPHGAAFLLDGDLRVELALLDTALLLDRRVAARVNGFVRFA